MARQPSGNAVGDFVALGPAAYPDSPPAFNDELLVQRESELRGILGNPVYVGNPVYDRAEKVLRQSFTDADIYEIFLTISSNVRRVMAASKLS